MLGRGGRRNAGGGGGGGGTYLEVANNLSDVANAGTSRASLGFTVNTAGRVLLGDGGTTMTSDSKLFFDTATKHLSVNLAAPGSGATLDVGGTDGGVGLPVLTTVERDALTPARNGVLIYNSTLHTLNAYQNGSWVNLGAHSSLSGLTSGDDHTQYALLAGRATGQVLKGGTAASETLTLQSTNHATRGKILFGSAGLDVYDEVNARFGIGIAAPTAKLHIKAGSANETVISLVNSSSAVPVDFRYETGSIFRLDQGAGSIFVYGNGCLNLMGTQLGIYKVQVQAPSTQTNAVTALTRNTGDTVFAVLNSSNTANNVSGLAFACSSTKNQTTSGIAGIHEVHTSAAEVGFRPALVATVRQWFLCPEYPFTGRAVNLSDRHGKPFLPIHLPFQVVDCRGERQWRCRVQRHVPINRKLRSTGVEPRAGAVWCPADIDHGTARVVPCYQRGRPAARPREA